MEQALVDEIVQKLTNKQTVFWVGAGVSMSGNSSLPSAPDLNTQCVQKYKDTVGQTLPSEATADLASLTEYLHNSGDLVRLFIHKLVPWVKFKNGTPNDSHIALADFLISHVAHAVISTNYDTRIECAAKKLGELDFVTSTDILDLNPRRNSLFFKIHGCAEKEEKSTFWCQSQRNEDPIKKRIEDAVKYLPGKLLNKDIVLVGYWSDWPHLYAAICEVLNSCEPHKVYIVNPLPPKELEKKAPDLWQWVTSKNHDLISENSDDFFSMIRRGLGRSTLRRAFAASIPTYQVMFKGFDDPDLELELPRLIDTLYWLRQDIFGIPRSYAVDTNDVDNPGTNNAAAFLLHLLNKGASFSHDHLIFNGKKIRVIGCSSMLAIIKDKYQIELDIHQIDTILVCPGAIDDGGAATNVVRDPIPRDVIRGQGSGEWCSLESARSELLA